MYLFESVFDLAYLALVNTLGIKLLLQRDRGAKLMGAMAVLLGFGDAFHLVPRVVSMWSPSGFEGNYFALSIGQLVTSITMTVFYVLFYLYYIRMTGKHSRSVGIAVGLLALVRIILTLLPQNGWGLEHPDYTWGIIRNIPFAILGILLMVLFFKERHAPGMKHQGVLVGISFLCYLPVVLFAERVPAVGALMMPKTIAYVGIIYSGYQNFIHDFNSESLLENGMVSLILALIAGVFYREFTKFYNFTGRTSLSFVHPHVIVIGTVLSIMLFILIRKISASDRQMLSKPILLLNTGLFFTAVMMVLRGITQILGSDFSRIPSAAVSGIAGIGHILLAAGLIWTLSVILKLERRQEYA